MIFPEKSFTKFFSSSYFSDSDKKEEIVTISNDQIQLTSNPTAVNKEDNKLVTPEVEVVSKVSSSETPTTTAAEQKPVEKLPETPMITPTVPEPQIISPAPTPTKIIPQPVEKQDQPQQSVEPKKIYYDRGYVKTEGKDLGGKTKQLKWIQIKNGKFYIFKSQNTDNHEEFVILREILSMKPEKDPKMMSMKVKGLLNYMFEFESKEERFVAKKKNIFDESKKKISSELKLGGFFYFIFFFLRTRNKKRHLDELDWVL